MRASGTIRSVLDAHELGVAAGDDEAVERIDDRQRRLAARPQERREEVALEVIDADERNAARPGERLARREADEERADQPGPGRRRDEADVLEPDARGRERLLERGRQVLEVRARRDLGHDAAVARVRRELRGDHVREHPALAVEHGDRRLVAGGLDAEDDHDGKDREALAPRRVAQPVVEADEGKRFGTLVAGDERGGELQRVGGAESDACDTRRIARARTRSTELTASQRSEASAAVARAAVHLVRSRGPSRSATSERRCDLDLGQAPDGSASASSA